MNLPVFYLRSIGCLLLTAVVLSSCSQIREPLEQTGEFPVIFPDYTEVTIPPNIAPLNFSLQANTGEAAATFKSKETEWEVKASGGQFTLPPNKWKALLQQAAGQSIEVVIKAKGKAGWKQYAPFHWYVAPEAIDPYIAYRLIEPGYEIWNQMGIYQRSLATYSESPVFENKLTGYNCVNCHSFCMQDPDRMLFHMRASFSGTILAVDGRIELLDTKTEHTLSNFVYPSWHPSGKYIAFSVNETAQVFHPTQRVEVYDSASDVIVYDIEKKQALITPAAASPSRFETFPTFSADGKTLYFCSAEARPMPDSVGGLKYSLHSISFNPDDGTFGDTVEVYHAEGQSVSFPRMSPDGKFLMCTVSAYGTFPIWHKDADLYIINLETGAGYFPEKINSPDTESYHSWSSNGRWIVFSSRRMDGLYTRPFIAYIDTAGQAAKPFVLPQKPTSFYSSSMKSYNIPEFTKSKVKIRPYRLMQVAKKSPAEPVTSKISTNWQ